MPPTGPDPPPRAHSCAVSVSDRPSRYSRIAHGPVDPGGTLVSTDATPRFAQRQRSSLFRWPKAGRVQRLTSLRPKSVTPASPRPQTFAPGSRMSCPSTERVRGNAGPQSPRSGPVVFRGLRACTTAPLDSRTSGAPFAGPGFAGLAPPALIDKCGSPANWSLENLTHRDDVSKQRRNAERVVALRMSLEGVSQNRKPLRTMLPALFQNAVGPASPGNRWSTALACRAKRFIDQRKLLV